MSLFSSPVETVLREQLEKEQARNAKLSEKYYALVETLARLKAGGAELAREPRPARVIGKARRQALERKAATEGDEPDEEEDMLTPAQIEAEARARVERKLAADLEREGVPSAQASAEARRIRQAALDGMEEI